MKYIRGRPYLLNMGICISNKVLHDVSGGDSVHLGKLAKISKLTRLGHG